MYKLESISFAHKNYSILSNIDLEIGAGNLNCLLGKNGSGKSTLLQLLSGDLKQKSGDIYFMGQRLGIYTQRELAKLRSVLLQDTRIQFSIRAEEIVFLGRYPYLGEVSERENCNIVEEALALVGSIHLQKRFY